MTNYISERLTEFEYRLVVGIRTRMESRYFEKLDPDPHSSEKLDSYPLERENPDPHKSEKIRVRIKVKSGPWKKYAVILNH
jgi:hypothetical protein